MHLISMRSCTLNSVNKVWNVTQKQDNQVYCPKMRAHPEVNFGLVKGSWVFGLLHSQLLEAPQQI